MKLGFFHVLSFFWSRSKSSKKWNPTYFVKTKGYGVVPTKNGFSSGSNNRYEMESDQPHIGFHRKRCSFYRSQKNWPKQIRAADPERMVVWLTHLDIWPITRWAPTSIDINRQKTGDLRKQHATWTNRNPCSFFPSSRHISSICLYESVWFLIGGIDMGLKLWISPSGSPFPWPFPFFPNLTSVDDLHVFYTPAARGFSIYQANEDQTVPTEGLPMVHVGTYPVNIQKKTGKNHHVSKGIEKLKKYPGKLT